MTPEEIKDQLKDTIISFIKQDTETAKETIHNVLAHKMRERVNPTEANPEDLETEDDDETLGTD